MAMPISHPPTYLREAFGRHPAGIVFVGGLVDNSLCGMAVSSFVPVSLDPPLVSFCVQNTSTTWPKLSGCPSLGVSVLGECHSGAVPTLSAKTGDRFADVTVTTSSDGAVLINGSELWLTGSVDQVVAAGDHSIVVLKLTSITIRDEVPPLIFYRSGCHALAVAPQMP
jgi:flavin reductase (DIM6/NTAB) family NADH-FMN oxidoreductase RutF